MEPLSIEWIKRQIQSGEYILSLHADEERRGDNLELENVEEALLNGGILEEYPDDKRGVSCLVNGTSQGKPIHVICGKNRSGWLVIITVYIPSEPKWETPVKRKKA